MGVTAVNGGTLTYLEQVRAHRERQRRLARAAEGVRQVEYEAPKRGKGWRPSRDPKPKPRERDWLLIASPRRIGAEIVGEADVLRIKHPMSVILERVSNWYGVTKEDLVWSRKNKIVLHRQVAMYLARTMVRASLPEIARRIGQRDHSTIFHAIRKVGRMIVADPVFAADVAALRLKIEESLGRDRGDDE